jgi:hypothetical protein
VAMLYVERHGEQAAFAPFYLVRFRTAAKDCVAVAHQPNKVLLLKVVPRCQRFARWYLVNDAVHMHIA